MSLNRPKKLFQRIVALVMCSLFIGTIIALGVAIKDYVKSGDDSGEITIKNNNITLENITQNDNGYRVGKEGGKIIIDFPKKTYITKLQYEYKIHEAVRNNVKIEIYFENIYGNQEVKEVIDNYSVYMARSVLTVKEDVYKIVIKYPEMDSEIQIANFIIDNSFKVNPLIAFFAVSSIFVVLFLICFRQENSKYPEIAVFVVVLVLSTTMLVLQKPYCTSWDEHIHFKNAYDLAVVPRDMGTPNAVKYLDDVANGVKGYLACDSIEEHIDLIRVLNLKGEEYGQPVEDVGIQMSSIGYVLSAAFITVGRFLGIPFYGVWLLGKFANVLLYAIGMSLAVAIVPIGKRLLSVIALLPTMIFLSTSYTYDVVVNVFIILAICIWLKEIVNEDQVFTVKWRIAYIVCMVIGCMPKAVYIPLLFCALLLPASKFTSKKDKFIFKSLIVVCCLIMASTFVLPALLTPADIGGDPRGGNTSVPEQLKYVLSMPIAYLSILWKSITSTIVKMMAGDWLCAFAYVGTVPQTEPYVALVVGTALTDTYKKNSNKNDFSAKYKVISIIGIIATIVLIWTALYLSFTEVGKTEISGVQGRYYFPFIFLVYLCLRSTKIKNTFSLVKYQMIIMLLACIILIYPIYSMFLITSCL